MDEKERTQRDYEILFNILYKFEKEYGLLSIDDVDLVENCKKLLMLSKSQLISYRFCPRAYKCVRILDLPSRQYDISRIGKNLHWVDCEFWKDLSKRPKFFENIDTRRDLRNFMLNRYIKFIPEEYREDPFIKQMANNFIDFEVERIIDIYNKAGKSRETIKRYVIPVALEVGIENWTRNLVGFIDRINRVYTGGKDAYCVIDYKYGKPKYYHENTLHKRNINLELGFYAILPQGDEVYVLNRTRFKKKDYLLPIEDVFDFKLEFYYGAMLFFQDMDTMIKFPIRQQTITNAYKAINRYWLDLNTGEFEPKTINWCWETPQGCIFYKNNCEIHPAWNSLNEAVLVEGYNYASDELPMDVFQDMYDEEMNLYGENGRW
jgi:hypothetical protein